MLASIRITDEIDWCGDESMINMKQNRVEKPSAKITWRGRKSKVMY